MDKKYLKELKESIKTKGLINPITFRRVGDSLVLVDGKYRLEACIQLKRPFSVHVIEMTDAQALEYSLTKSEPRIKTTPEETKRHLKRLMSRGYSVKQIAERIGRSESWVYRRLKS